MATSFFIISKEYKEKEELRPVIEKIAEKRGWLFFDETGKRSIEYKLNTKDFENSFSIYYKDRERFEPSFSEIKELKEYGAQLSIYVNFGDEIIIPFLQDFFAEFPEMLLYNSDIGSEYESGVYVFGKQDVDDVKDEDIENYYPVFVKKSKYNHLG